MVPNRSRDGEPPIAGGGNVAAPYVVRRGGPTPAAMLIEKYLGPGVSELSETLWKPAAHGRSCLVFLRTWANDTQTVTTLDAARGNTDMVRNIDASGPDGLDELEAELRSLTVTRPAHDGAGANGGPAA